MKVNYFYTGCKKIFLNLNLNLNLFIVWGNDGDHLRLLPPGWHEQHSGQSCPLWLPEQEFQVSLKFDWIVGVGLDCSTLSVCYVYITFSFCHSWFRPGTRRQRVALHDQRGMRMTTVRRLNNPTSSLLPSRRESVKRRTQDSKDMG